MNLTPHELVAYGPNDQKVIIPSSGNARMVEEKSKGRPPMGIFMGIPVYPPQSFDVLEGVPDPLPKDTKAIFVSMPVGLWLNEHPNVLPNVDILGPDTGPENCVRNEKGQIIGCKAFVSYRPLLKRVDL